MFTRINLYSLDKKGEWTIEYCRLLIRYTLLVNGSTVAAFYSIDKLCSFSCMKSPFVGWPSLQWHYRSCGVDIESLLFSQNMRILQNLVNESPAIQKTISCQYSSTASSDRLLFHSFPLPSILQFLLPITPLNPSPRPNQNPHPLVDRHRYYP